MIVLVAGLASTATPLIRCDGLPMPILLRMPVWVDMPPWKAGIRSILTKITYQQMMPSSCRMTIGNRHQRSHILCFR